MKKVAIYAVFVSENNNLSDYSTAVSVGWMLCYATFAAGSGRIFGYCYIEEQGKSSLPSSIYYHNVNETLAFFSL